MKIFSIKLLSLFLLSAFLSASLATPSEAGIRDRDWFSNKIESKFWIRGRCWISNGNGDEVVDYTSKVSEATGSILKEVKNPKVKIVGRILSTAGKSIEELKKIVPKDGHAKCIVKKRKREKGVIRPSKTVTVNMNTFGYAGTEGDTVAVTVASRTKSCGGKKRCTVIMKPKEDTVPVGAAACIEAKGKSRVVHIGLVPDELKTELANSGAFREETCSTRNDWQSDSIDSSTSPLVSSEQDDRPLLGLFSWWNPERGDNFASTDPRWSMNPEAVPEDGGHIPNGPQKSGYTLYRLEGLVFNPRYTQPERTVPLYSWWNPERGDNFASTDPRWSMNPEDLRWNGEHIPNGRQKSGYTLYRLEGYIFDPKKPQPPNTIPVYSWWNPERGDNFLTTDPRWSMNPEEVRWDGEHLTNGRNQSGYTMYRLEGYVYPPTYDY